MRKGILAVVAALLIGLVVTGGPKFDVSDHKQDTTEDARIWPWKVLTDALAPDAAEASTAGVCPAWIIAVDANPYPSFAGWYYVHHKNAGIATGTVYIGSSGQCRLKMNIAYYLIMYAQCSPPGRCPIYTD